MLRPLSAGMLLLLINNLSFFAYALDYHAEPLSVCDPQGKSCKDIRIEVAQTPEQRANGLMFRKKLEEGTGMLFTYSQPQPIAMWMKNTLIPLDMVFIDARNRVHHVHENAHPYDETRITSQGVARAVLEIPGGSASRFGFIKGDHVRHPLLPPYAPESHSTLDDNGTAR